ncbi:TRAP transporter small permease subunit [Sulfitobacter sp. BDSS02]|nr:TRAP transporter small permease subunit [Sulfitobacter sp. BDSS02]MBR9848106.1 TRAP transporter small permease [Paracoccaceae bacterium]
MTRISNFLATCATCTSVLAGAAVALMMVQVTLDVAMRHLFGSPLPGTLTIVSYYYMVIAAFVPLALAEQRDAHISVEFVTDLMPKGVQRHLAGLMLLPTALVTAMLTWRTWEAALSAMAKGTAEISGATKIAVWPAYFALPLGAGLMTLILALRFALYVTGKTPQEAPE